MIRKIKEAPPRQGFFEPAAFEAVRRELRPDLRVAVALAYALGWRTQSEVLPLARRQVDLQSGTIRLDPGQAKNEEGRVVYLPADLQALVATQVKQVRALERKLGRIIASLPAPPGAAPGGADQGFPPRVAGGLPAREGRADAPARLPAHGGPEFGRLGCLGARGHGSDGPQDPLGV